MLGSALLAQRKSVAAIAILESVVVRASDFGQVPDFAHACTNLARAYHLEGREEEARDQLNLALKIVPALDVAWLAYGDVLVDFFKYADAKFAYEQARLLEPFLARIDHARTALAVEDRKTAEVIFKDILQ